MSKRLIKIAKELNIGTSVIVEFLVSIGFDIENKPTAKVSNTMELELRKRFASSISNMDKANKLEFNTRPSATVPPPPPLPVQRRSVPPPPPPLSPAPPPPAVNENNNLTEEVTQAKSSGGEPNSLPSLRGLSVLGKISIKKPDQVSSFEDSMLTIVDISKELEIDQELIKKYLINKGLSREVIDKGLVEEEVSEILIENLKINSLSRLSFITSLGIMEIVELGGIDVGDYDNLNEFVVDARINDLAVRKSGMNIADRVNFIMGEIKQYEKIIIKEINDHSGVLDLSGCDIEEIPSEVFSLDTIWNLDLSNNSISKISKSIVELKNLRVLNLNNNKLAEVPRFITDMQNIHYLDISNNDIDELTSEIGFLSQLNTLNASFNKIETIPDKIKRCSNLSTLLLNNNMLKNISAGILELKRLESLDLSNNRIEFFLKDVAFIPSLSDLRIQNNPIGNIPAIRFNKDGNRLKAIHDHFYSLSGKNITNIYETKLILIGEPESGKTSIAKKLKDPYSNISDEKSTEGINIKRWDVDVSDIDSLKNSTSSVRINIWDLGGQELYRSTHKFFLTNNAIYLLVWNARTGNIYDHLSYWLNMVATFTEGSRLILVKNKIEQRKEEVDLNYLKTKFPVIEDYSRVSCLKNIGINGLVQSIKEQVSKLSNLSADWSTQRVKVREHLEQKIEKPFIQLSYFKQICNQYSIDQGEVEEFLEYLNDLGVVIYFKDNPALKSIIFLDADWVTSAVYDVLDRKQLKKYPNRGKFTEKDLEYFWVNKVDFKDKVSEIIELMKHYKICFELPKTNMARVRNRVFVAPELLPEIPSPYVPLDDQYSISLILEYDFLPSGILISFICDNYYLVEAENVWKNGTILFSNRQLTNSSARAEIIFDPIRPNQLLIKVSSENKDDRITFLNHIRNSFSKIHDFHHTNLSVREKVPCSCKSCTKLLILDRMSKISYFSYSLLRKCIERKKEYLFCEVSFTDVKVRNMLEGIQFSGKNLFVSYSKEDVDLKNELIKQLKTLERIKKIKIWEDSKIEMGAKWRQVLFSQLEQSDIVILLLSDHYISTDFCWEELEISLEMEKKRNIKIIPVILSNFSWEGLPISQFQVFPSKNSQRSIDQFADRSVAWKEIVNYIGTVNSPKKP